MTGDFDQWGQKADPSRCQPQPPWSLALPLINMPRSWGGGIPFHAELRHRIKLLLLGFIWHTSDRLLLPRPQRSWCSPEKLIWISIPLQIVKQEWTHLSLGGLLPSLFLLIPFPTVRLKAPLSSSSGSGVPCPRLVPFPCFVLFPVSSLWSGLPDVIK